MGAAPESASLFCMTAWIVLLAVTVAFALAARRSRRDDLSLPPGYDGERARGATYPN
jgi:hypothetical protein